MSISTADRVLDALKPFGLKQEKPGQSRCNRPWSPESNSMSLTITITDPEHGAYYDHVTGESGSLYELAERLGIEVNQPNNQKNPASETKRSYKGLAEYSAAHGVDKSVFKDAGWEEWKSEGRLALRFPTPTGNRLRFLDGEKPTFKSPPGYKSCIYKQEEAIVIAKQTNQPLIICNGEPSVIPAQNYGIPAICITGGEGQNIREDLLLGLQNAYSGKIIITPDCDGTGRKMGQSFKQQLTDVGFDVTVLDLNGGTGFDLGDFCTLNREGSSEALTDLHELSFTETENGTNNQKPVEFGLSITDWESYNLEEAYQPRPPIGYVVDCLIEEASLSILYGAPGCMKSLTLADMAICVAGGIDWLLPSPDGGGKAFKVKQGPVVWIDFDNGKRRNS